MPTTGLPSRTPRSEIEQPRTMGREKEPTILIDWSGSMREKASPDSPMTKVELVKTAVPIIVRKLAGEDSQAAHETGTGKGGVRAFYYDVPDPIQFEKDEDESDDPRDLGDLNEANVVEVLGNMPEPQYQTWIMPAIHAAEHAYQAEFGDRPLRNRPAIELVVIGDGKFNDAREFEEWVKQADETCVVCVALIGYGSGHDEALQHLQKIADDNPYVSVVALTGVSDPEEVALDVQLMAA